MVLVGKNGAETLVLCPLVESLQVDEGELFLVLDPEELCGAPFAAHEQRVVDHEQGTHSVLDDQAEDLDEPPVSDLVREQISGPCSYQRDILRSLLNKLKDEILEEGRINYIKKRILSISFINISLNLVFLLMLESYLFLLIGIVQLWRQVLERVKIEPLLQELEVDLEASQSLVNGNLLNFL